MPTTTTNVMESRVGGDGDSNSSIDQISVSTIYQQPPPNQHQNHMSCQQRPTNFQPQQSPSEEVTGILYINDGRAVTAGVAGGGIGGFLNVLI